MKAYFRSLLDALDRYDSVVQATVIRASGSVPRGIGAKMLIFPDGRTEGTVGGGIFESVVVQDSLQVHAGSVPLLKTYSFNQEGKYAIGAVCGGSVEVLMEVIKNSPRLYVVGGGHVGQALVRAAALLDFDITLIDDRVDYAVLKQPMPGVKTVHTPEDFSSMPPITENTYICLVSKGYVSDESALRRILNSPARYIGMIGSRKKINTVFSNMLRDGFDQKQLDRVHAPIGLEIKADAPEEIAVSILAEIIALKNNDR